MKKRLFFLAWLAIILVITDEIAKKISLNRFLQQNNLPDNRIFTFGLHKNYGIAFDLPLKMPLIIIITVSLIIIFSIIVWRTYKRNSKVAFGFFLILVGAIGNLFDRIICGFTIDYLIFFNQSAINLSDLIIIFGIVWLIFSKQNTKTKNN